MEENEKLKMGLSELGNLERVRSASVAMNVWQPEIVRGKQKRVVEQCVVPVESRVKGVEMEIRVCKQQIKVLDKGYREELRRLDEAKRKLVSMVYHPLRDYGSTEAVDECKGKTKRKKSKQCSEKFCSSGDKC
ncbi:hypothetical protein IFM89_002461 [Coptis chinensis]|uniref:Uncharacterized protein n=1 Tax=Coptis chinensis TaxID=261450 RepID=A0A835IJ11_9MAGN|nr:hypothetical protein IFM89_002461 [Coptis chinensis]